MCETISCVLKPHKLSTRVVSAVAAVLYSVQTTKKLSITYNNKRLAHLLPESIQIHILLSSDICRETFFSVVDSIAKIKQSTTLNSLSVNAILSTNILFSGFFSTVTVYICLYHNNAHATS